MKKNKDLSKESSSMTLSAIKDNYGMESDISQQLDMHIEKG